MSSDIVRRLRRAHEHDGLMLPAEAADRIQQLERDNAALQAELAKAREALAELERYVALTCYDKWLPDGHEKSQALSDLLHRSREVYRALQQKEREAAPVDKSNNGENPQCKL